MRGDGDGAGADEKEDVKPEELLAERAAASAKVVLSEGPFSESETDQSDKDKDCGEEIVLGGKNSETECEDENETRPLTGSSCALIPQVRSQACDRKKFFLHVQKNVGVCRVCSPFVSSSSCCSISGRQKASMLLQSDPLFSFG